MSETSKLYYDDPSAMASEGKIIALRESGSNTDVILDRTVFFPEGGGQPCDLGTLGGVPVLKVMEEGLAIVHTVQGHPSLAAGDTISMSIDAARRRDHSQQHSGQHLLSAVLERKFGIHTVGFHLGATYCTIDVTCAGMDSTMIADIESTAETFIVEDHPFSIHICPPENPEAFPIRKNLPSGEAIIRIVEIAEYDWVACCGTHVASAGELRVLKILLTEKYKGNTRIYFVAGDRAIRLLTAHYRLIKDVAEELGAAVEAVPSRVSALLQRSGVLEAENAGLTRERASLEIERALGGNEPVSSQASAAPMALKRAFLRFTYTDRSAEAAFETAKAGAARGVAVVAVSVPDRVVCAMAPASSSTKAADPGGAQGTTSRSIALGAALKPLLQRFGGKGGGSANNFRAAFETAENAEAFASEVASLLG